MSKGHLVLNQSKVLSGSWLHLSIWRSVANQLRPEQNPSRLADCQSTPWRREPGQTQDACLCVCVCVGALSLSVTGTLPALFPPWSQCCPGDV